MNSFSRSENPHCKNESFFITMDFHTDTGCRRQTNEDSVYCVDPQFVDCKQKGMLALIADGMGGHNAGDVASQTAIETISRFFYAKSGDRHKVLEKAFFKANRMVYRQASRDSSLKGMGTTCSGIAVAGGLAYCAHVGDSRVYLIRKKAIYQMTEDHSLVMEMVKQGFIDRGQANHHEDKNIVSRAIGTHRSVKIDTWNSPFPVMAGDRFLLCTDGLTDLVSDSEMNAVIQDVSNKEACENLAALAMERNGQDNITVVLVIIQSNAKTFSTTGLPL